LNSSNAFLEGGREITALGKKRSISRTERILPAVIFHRKYLWGKSQELFIKLERTYTDLLISYHPCFQHFTTKSIAECCFKECENKYYVCRPKTFLFNKIELLQNLKHIACSNAVIIKPSNSSCCNGIYIPTSDTLQHILEQIQWSHYDNYIIQELVKKPVLYNGKKFDLRVYALITSLNPLTYTIYKEGVTRIAAKKYEKTKLQDPLISLTGSTFRKRLGIKPENITITQLLEYLKENGYHIDDFWDKVDKVLRNVFKCFALYCHKNKANMKRRFFLIGADLILKNLDNHNDSFKIVFLEMNHVPQLEDWGKEVDLALLSIHHQWLTDIWKLWRRTD
jgi:hypothetical protein